MKYLNERITQQINLGSVQPKGMYKYEVQVTNRIEQSGFSTAFIAECYGNYEGGEGVEIRLFNTGTRDEAIAEEDED